MSQVLSAEYQSTPASSPSAVFLFTRYACEPKITSELRALWVVCLCEHITYSSAVYLVEQRQWRSSRRARRASVKCVLILAGINYKLPARLLRDDSHTPLTSDLLGLFCKPCKMQVLYAHNHSHREQHIITADKQSVGIKQLHSAVINNLGDSPDALLSFVPLAPCQSTLKKHCIAPQCTPLFCALRSHTGPVNRKVRFRFRPSVAPLRCCWE